MQAASKSLVADRVPAEQLETVIAIPPLPFRAGVFDPAAHRKNMLYLVERNFLADGRRRAIGIAGTSLVHHIDSDTLLEAVRVTGEAVGERAIVIGGLVATPPKPAREFVARAMALPRPPDFFLLMPIPGVCNPAGIRAELGALVQETSERCGARFLVYMRDSSLMQAYAGLLAGSPAIVGIKIGTKEADVARMRALVGDAKKVLWGVGDRATEAAGMGSRGHTSGITLICPRACDEIHNAYSREDFGRSAELETVIAELEEIRFMDGRVYNYSAVVVAAQLGAFGDVDLGDGGPFNAPPPPEIMNRIAKTVEMLKAYH